MSSPPESIRAQRHAGAAEVAGVVAHDLNNIVTSLLAYTQYVLDALPADSLLRSDVTEIQQAGEEAAALARRLMIFGRRRIQPEPVDLEQALPGMEYRPIRGRGSGAQVRVEPGPGGGEGGARIRVDREQLQAGIQNLIECAAGAAGEAEIRISTSEITLAAELRHHGGRVPPGRYIVLTATHRGEIPEESVARLHQLHFGGRWSLGLVHGMLRHAGGYLVIERPAEATRYRLYFPAAEEPEIAPSGRPS